ncbi:MAG: lipase maturation factor family protein [Verrucomicrobiales bacterium]|nr:lipase maturation factor family protein [Verrucomicrobiales bacterium]
MNGNWLHWLWSPGETHALARVIYLRGLAAIYLVALLSWWVQVETLVGSRGIVPMAEFLDHVGETLHVQGYSRFGGVPTVFWVEDADWFIHAVCGIGVVLALVVLAGYAAGPGLVGLWFIYLSLLGTGGFFMHFQWDILLLEAGFLAIFLAPWRRWRLRADPLGWGERIALWLQWFLIAKLMFQSGWVKLAWATPDQPEWWPDGTAMTFHYVTQPIPAWTSWWMHQLPEWFHRASLWPMYGVELVLPVLVFLGPRLRLVAAAGFAGLMLAILATGNYTYFNWLTIVLCIPLVADRYWRWRPGRKKPAVSSAEQSGLSGNGGHPAFSEQGELASLALRAVPLGLVALLNGMTVLGDLHAASAVPGATLQWARLERDPVPEFLLPLARAVQPWHLVSGYGLFRTMTTERPEIVLEGTVNGVTWREYELRHKPGRLGERPRFVAPHQPRVAWQFWFAALERQYHPRSRNAAWMTALILQLLENDPVALALFRENPFPDQPPERIRAKLYLYEFTTPAERRETGHWWKRRETGLYLPPVGRDAAG